MDRWSDFYLLLLICWYVLICVLFVCLFFLVFVFVAFFSENRGEKEHFYLCKVHLKNGRGLRELPLSGALETTGTRLSRVFSGNVRKSIDLHRKRTITLHVKLYSWLSTSSRNSVFQFSSRNFHKMVAVLARNADFCTVLTWLKFYFLQMALLVVIGITPRAPTTGTTLVAWLSKVYIHRL